MPEPLSFFWLTEQLPPVQDTGDTSLAIRNESLFTVGAKLPFPLAVSLNCSGTVAVEIEALVKVATNVPPCSGWVRPPGSLFVSAPSVGVSPRSTLQVAYPTGHCVIAALALLKRPTVTGPPCDAPASAIFMPLCVSVG